MAVLESFKFILELAGFQVATCSSGVAFLRDGLICPRCLILNHHMPVMTGLEPAARLRAQGHAVPIMLITSQPSPMMIARATELGIARFLEKPPTGEDLLHFVQTHC